MQHRNHLLVPLTFCLTFGSASMAQAAEEFVRPTNGWVTATEVSPGTSANPHSGSADIPAPFLRPSSPHATASCPLCWRETSGPVGGRL